jgi:hypothetical protein
MFDWLRRLFHFNSSSKGDWLTMPALPETPQGPYIPGYEVSDTDAVMPKSKSISGVFCRWHNRPTLPTVVPLWRTFFDDAQKWSSKGRFAGSEKNCGHFFAFTEDVATAEAKHYGVDLSETEMLEIRARIDNVLDLTIPEGRKLAYEAVVERPDASDPFIAEELIEEPTGGTILTDRIGYWAAKRSYEAIGLLPEIGARARVRSPAILSFERSTRWHGRTTRRSRRSGCCGRPRYG